MSGERRSEHRPRPAPKSRKPLLGSEPAFWYPAQGGVPFIATALTPVALAFRAGATLKRLTSRPQKVSAPVLCVGNVVAGGSGKTPICLYLAEKARNLGRKPAFLTRGYGGSLKQATLVDPNRHSAEETGDEALLLAASAPTAKCADRAAGAHLAIEAGADCLIMDDGFQNFGLAKDFSLLVIDGPRGLGNGLLMPAGPLREPFMAALDRADAVVAMGPVRGARPALALAEEEGVPILHAHTQTQEAESFRGLRAIAFAGIGTPQKFFASLTATGALVGMAIPFPDHHPFSEEDAEKLLTIAQQTGGTLVTTAKDLARLSGSPAGSKRAELANACRTLRIEVVFDRPDLLDELLHPVLNG